MQEGVDDLLFVEASIGREGKNIHAVEIAVGCLNNEPLDSIDNIRLR